MAIAFTITVDDTSGADTSFFFPGTRAVGAQVSSTGGQLTYYDLPGDGGNYKYHSTFTGSNFAYETYTGSIGALITGAVFSFQQNSNSNIIQRGHMDIAFSGDDIGGTGIAMAASIMMSPDTLMNAANSALKTFTMIGNAGADKLTASSYADTLNGQGGADVMIGRDGSDTYYADNAGDKVIEAVGEGTDTVRASATFALGAGTEVEVLRTTDDAGTGALNLFGNELAQTITGNDGANNLVGNGGNDTISARGGADGLQGGAGNDTMAGNGGNDGFYFNTALNAATNVDRILDFGQATGNADLIRLDNAIFTTLGAAGFLNPDFFKANATGLATQSDDHIVYETDTGKLFYDTNGNTAGGATQFATLTNFAGLTGANTITAADFYVF